MRSQTLFFISVIALLISALGLFLFAFQGGFNGRGYGTGEKVPRSLWLVLFAVPLIVAISVFGYAMIFPELSEKKLDADNSSIPATEKEKLPLDAILRVLNDDERKVVETIVAEGGTMLQKDIRWKTGLSRVKTHRILFRLANRGIVSAEKYYNTNKIVLADWLSK